MRVLIVGVNHQIQSATIHSFSSDGTAQKFEQEQKELFAELTRSKIREITATFVAEEARHGEETVTQRVCMQEGCRYANVEMTPEERAARNIPAGYNEDFPDMSADEKTRFNSEREEYLAAKAMAEARGAGNILMVCGSSHSKPLAELFRQSGYSVVITSIQQENWYVEDWQHHMMHNL